MGTRIIQNSLWLATMFLLSNCFGKSELKELNCSVTGVEIYNNTGTIEDCNVPMIVFDLEIENTSNKLLKLKSGFEKGICVYNRTTPELKIVCESCEDMKLKIVSNDSVIQPNSKLKIKAALVNYQIEGSLTQIKNAAIDKFGKDFFLEGEFIEEIGEVKFICNRELNYVYILNNEIVRVSDKKSINEGKLPKVIFNPKKKIDLVPPK